MRDVDYLSSICVFLLSIWLLLTLNALSLGLTCSLERFILLLSKCLACNRSVMYILHLLLHLFTLITDCLHRLGKFERGTCIYLFIAILLRIRLLAVWWLRVSEKALLQHTLVNKAICVEVRFICTLCIDSFNIHF